MAEQQSRFDDGAAYERMMGTWSRLAGETFLDWLALPPRLRCIDIGCGNGAFTELLVERCAPAEVEGIDPSKAQLDFARARPCARLARFEQGDALALPFADNSFDAAFMALVIFFLPDPAKGVAEMARIVRPGGIVATYAWDLLGGGSPLHPVDPEMRALGLEAQRSAKPEAARIDALRGLWTGAGLEAVETWEIPVQRSFADFEEFWSITVAGSLLKQSLAAANPADAELVKSRMRAKLTPDAAGRITYQARANAIKGRVPK
jgi:ubiquinone/menaquinone biosynthesis C-methylase UbiE